jgi:hypothetical protein
LEEIIARNRTQQAQTAIKNIAIILQIEAANKSKQADAGGCKTGV